MLAKLLFSIAFILSFLLGFAEQSPNSLFKDANELYDSGQYDSSLTLYRSIEELGMVSPELFQNMGTAAYKLEMVPDAVFYFEKGLKLDPGNEDLKHNLEIANKKITDRSETVTRTGIGDWLSNALGGNPDLWATFAIIASVIGAVLVIMYLFLKVSIIKKFGIYAGGTSWVLAALFTIIAFLQFNSANDGEYGILFEPSIEVRNDPSEAASTAFVLHEGSKLKILDQNEHWFKVSFGKSKVGWLPKKSLKII